MPDYTVHVYNSNNTVLNDRGRSLSSEHLLDNVSRHRVEEESQDGSQQEDDENLEYDPFVVMPENVSD
jgi:hypothetical protein